MLALYLQYLINQVRKAQRESYPIPKRHQAGIIHFSGLKCLKSPVSLSILKCRADFVCYTPVAGNWRLLSGVCSIVYRPHNLVVIWYKEDLSFLPLKPLLSVLVYLYGSAWRDTATSTTHGDFLTVQYGLRRFIFTASNSSTIECWLHAVSML